MIRFCPNCQTERPLQEFFCEGAVNEQPCHWDLSGETIHETGWRPALIITAEKQQSPPDNQPVTIYCQNGHEMSHGDLLCLNCGADAALTNDAPTAASNADSIDEQQPIAGETHIDDWRLLKQLSATESIYDRYYVENTETQRQATLILYHIGSEPETGVYGALAKISIDHIPEIIAVGRWQNQAYAVIETLSGETLADIDFLISSDDEVRHIVAELGTAINALSEAGIRHRGLRPEVLLIRQREPLDLLITGFGSARLSDFDLDIVSPLETSAYMAPEAIIGAVSPASDWWSLGMILLEQLTNGACFAGIHPKALLIHVLTNGIELPETLSPELKTLLKGLLIRDHHLRWQWPQIKAWLAGEFVELPSSEHSDNNGAESLEAISLDHKSYYSPKLFALRAAQTDVWPEAKTLIERGVLSTWLESIAFPAQTLADLRQIIHYPSLNDDWRLMLVLKLLNENMPLVLRGDIVTPGWLLANPQEGYQLINSAVPQLIGLLNLSQENWLVSLQLREKRVRERAAHLEIGLNEDALKIYLLNTSQARLLAIWQDRQSLFPEAYHQGLQLLLERRTFTEEDLIVLLSAELNQYCSAEDILSQAVKLSSKNAIKLFSKEQAAQQIRQTKADLYQTLNERLNNFSCCNIDVLDQWAQKFRIEKRLPFAELLLLLSVPVNQWVVPPKQKYLTELLNFFERKVVASSLRGSLVRTVTSDRSANIDLMDLNSGRVTAPQILEHIIKRHAQPRAVDPEIFTDNNLIYRLALLFRKDDLYRRDTGIEGLYLGFPYLLVPGNTSNQTTRVMPLLLWPVTLNANNIGTASASLAFDRSREEIRLNPVLSHIIGTEACQKWQTVTDELLSRSSVDIQEVMEFLGMAATKTDYAYRSLAEADKNVARGETRLVCSAVLFHATFTGQSVIEDLKLIKREAADKSALSSLFYPGEDISEAIYEQPQENNRYLISHSDPSQERAIHRANSGPGLLIEGPPGTGKSQTIVNIVADVIGKQQSLLVICQKRAALEVVYKRLVAEGLEQRVVMVNDIHKDRLPVIRAIREQLENGQRFDDDPTLAQQRERQSALIAKLEQSLDSYHQLLFKQDERIGLSYRELLSELISIDNDKPENGLGSYDLSASALRKALLPNDTATLSVLAENCAPLVALWLSAHYEENPLKHLKQFYLDQPELNRLSSALTHFQQTENSRIELVRRSKTHIVLNDIGYIQHWFDLYSARFNRLTDREHLQISHWLPLFKVPGQSKAASRGAEIQARLADIISRLTMIPVSNYCPLFFPELTALRDSVLVDLVTAIADFRQQRSFWQSLSVGYLIKRMRLKRFFSSVNIVEITPKFLDLLEKAVELEQQWRPCRNELSILHTELNQTPIRKDDGLQLLSLAGNTYASLKQNGELINGLIPLPEVSYLEQALISANQFIWADTLEKYLIAFQQESNKQQSLQWLTRLNEWFSEDWVADYRDKVANNQKSFEDYENVKLLIDYLPYAINYQQFRAKAASLSESELAFFAALAQYHHGLQQIETAHLSGYIKRLINWEARLAWKARLEQEHPELAVNQSEIKDKVTALAEADLAMKAFNKKVLSRNIDNKRLASLKRWEDVTRLSGQRTRRLREFIEQAKPLGLMTLRPVWLMTPDIASRVLPLQPELFDTVIYDEASQMPIEYAIPTLFRCNKVIVSGDEKQMPPTSFFAGQIDDDEDEQDEVISDLADKLNGRQTELNKQEIKDCSDLLQLSRRILPKTTLQIHYRSVYKELISFSNAAFYGNQLQVPRYHSPTQINQIKPLQLIEVNGLYHEQMNKDEAGKVIELLVDIWQQPYESRPSVGIVTFNQKQASFIEDLIEVKASKDEPFKKAYLEESSRIEKGEDMSLFVKSVENVQGDERDMIIFSSTFGRNETGKFIRNFGALGHQGGERRLNVAITRARKKVVIVSSMPIEDISDMLKTQRAPIIARDYLQIYWAYARALTQGDFDVAGQLLQCIQTNRGGLSLKDQVLINRGSDSFNLSVSDYIQSLGWRIMPAERNNAFGLDFMIEHPETGQYFMGIECDMPQHRLLRHARSREIWRLNLLRQIVPSIHRLTSRDWYHQPEQEKVQLKLAIENAYQIAKETE